MENDELLSSSTTAADVPPLSLRNTSDNHPIGGDTTGQDSTETSRLLPRPDGAEEEPSSGQQSSVDRLPWWKRPSVLWIVPSFAISSLILGGNSVTKLNLILSLICHQNKYDKSQAWISTLVPECSQNPQVQAAFSRFSVWNSLLAGIISALACPQIGMLSDRYGRRKIIALNTLGKMFAEVLTIVIAKYPDTFSFYWLLLGSTVDALAGGFLATVAVTNAYASDCTSGSSRAVAFTYLQGAMFLGIAFGPLITGYIVEYAKNLVVVFYIAFFAHLACLCLLLVTPESLSEARQLHAREMGKAHQGDQSSDLDESRSWIRKVFQDSTTRTLHHVRGVMSPLSIFGKSASNNDRRLQRNKIMLAAVDTISFGMVMGSVNCVFIYAEYRFNWDNFETSVFASITSICRVIMLVMILPLLAWLNRSGYLKRIFIAGQDAFDLYVVRISILGDLIAHVGYAFATTGSVYTVAGCLSAVGSMASPTLQSALTRHVEEENVGQLLGAMGLLHAVAGLVIPTIANILYAETITRGIPQVIFICFVAMFTIVEVVAWFIVPASRFT